MRRRPSPAALLSILALSVAIGGTALAGSNSVTSLDIVDGEVKTQDVRDETGAGALKGVDVATDALGSSDVALSSVTADEVLDDSVRGLDITDNSVGPSQVNGLTGGDILESSLGAVGGSLDANTLDGLDSGELVAARFDGPDTGECSGSLPSSSFETCADATVPWPHAGRALVIASGNWHSISTPAVANCRITGPGVADSPSLAIGATANYHPELRGTRFVAQEVTELLTVPASGERTFAVECAQIAGSSDVDNTEIAVIVVGSA